MSTYYNYDFDSIIQESQSCMYDIAGKIDELLTTNMKTTEWYDALENLINEYNRHKFTIIKSNELKIKLYN